MPNVQDVRGARVMIHLEGGEIKVATTVGWGFTAFLCLKAMWSALEKDSKGTSGLEDLLHRADRGR